ncbi:EAL domain-containing protein [Marinobacterium sp. AK62]|uniref:EAL domain-containing protein n=1 Tax=Marinobacterium alkalitolerans TaxID=1542925 RepID=A0ABS3ZA92_9GAMM|nr:EAL domain-containing protein [Marinobacterium alkalitolerans]MBP0048208.1 EAL domain-containing protein [Marinobacterium alkalitolerans]
MQSAPCKNDPQQQRAEREELESILSRELLQPHFQPILDLRHGRLIGHEALIRGPQGSCLQMPSDLFRCAIEQGRQLELELLCRKCSLQAFARFSPGRKLFLNVTASLLSSPDHQHGFTADLLRQLGIPIDMIVIELSEQHPFDQHGLTRAAVEHYRNMGFQIAIDDLGAGYSGLKLWSELQPEYVKIDQHFVRALHQDPVKREFVHSISRIGRNLGCQVLAEGIEEMAEMRVLQTLGVELGQGFLLGRPEVLPRPQLSPAQIRRPLPARWQQSIQRGLHSLLPPRSWFGF